MIIHNNKKTLYKFEINLHLESMKKTNVQGKNQPKKKTIDLQCNNKKTQEWSWLDTLAQQSNHKRKEPKKKKRWKNT
jgi:hypothetical protein